MDLDDAKTGGGRDKAPMASDLLDVYRFPPKKWVTLRLMPGLMSTAQYWVRTKKKAGGFTKFPTPCPSYDPESQERDSTKYDPWRDLEAAERSKNGDKKLERDQVLVQYGRDFWMNAIIRSLQKSEPESKVKHTAKERKTGFKEKDSDSWTPCRGIKLGTSFMGKVKELKGLNTVESTKTGAVKAYAVNDLKFGRDIRVYYDPDKSPADQYNIQLGDKRTPLTEDELALLTYDLDTLKLPVLDEDAQEKADAELKRDFESWASRNGVKVAKGKSKPADDEDDDEDEGEEDTPKSKKKQAKKLADDFDDEDEDGDDDEDEPPKKKSKPAAKGKKPPVDEDEEEEDDEDEPPKKSSKKPAPKGKKAAVDDDEDDFDEDEDEDDEPPKSKKKPPAKKKPVDEDEDDFDEDDEPPAKKKKPVANGKKFAKDDDESEDFDDDEDEDEDEPPKKSAKKPVAKAKSKKPAADEDDDFDDEDEDGDEDEDDEPPAKKKPVAKGKPVAKKKSKSVDDDEDDENF